MLEAERKRQEMMAAQKEKGGKKSQDPAMDARKEMSKSKEQVEEEMKISLSIRIKPLALNEMDSDELRNKASSTMVFQIEFALFLSSSESISLRAKGLIRILREIFISSSTCSLDLDISLRASMAGAWDFLPPFSFCAAIISCLLRSASSRAFFFSRASASLLSPSSFSYMTWLGWLELISMLGSSLSSSISSSLPFLMGTLMLSILHCLRIVWRVALSLSRLASIWLICLLIAAKSFCTFATSFLAFSTSDSILSTSLFRKFFSVLSFSTSLISLSISPMVTLSAFLLVSNWSSTSWTVLSNFCTFC